MGNHTFIHSPNHISPSAPRDIFDNIMNNHVNWYPYNSLMTRLSSVVHHDMNIWMDKITFVHF
jgi:hypothetical protein